MSSINVVKLKELITTDPNLVIIDIRTKEEVAGGRIPNSVWMDVSDKGFMLKATTLPKEKTYCLYCASGGRTSMVVPFMEMNGYKKIFDLGGGIMAWISAGEQVV